MTRRRLILVGIIVAALCASFATGRYTRTVATRDERKVESSSKEVTKAATVAHVDEASHAVAVAATDAKTHTIIRWLPAVVAANGCPAIPAHVEQETVAETHAATTSTTDKARASSLSAKQERTAEGQQSVVETHATEARPTWSATALLGVQDGGKRLVSAVPAPIVAGVVLERRIIGPVSLGLWGTTARAGGLSVSLSF